jgi:hypothetical protein
MFDKALKAFWKALTPDLVVDEPAKPVLTLDKTVLAALGGAGNIKTEQRVALTRIRVSWPISPAWIRKPCVWRVCPGS